MKNFERWKMISPYFEEDGGNGGGGTPDPTGDDGEKKPTFDEMLKDKEYQAEFDRRISKAIETRLAKETERLEALYSDKLTEQEKLAKMNADEKRRFEDEKRQKELADREKAISLRELKADAKNMLIEAQLSPDFAELINYESADSVKESITNIKKTFAKSVQDAVDERLKGEKPPKDASTEHDDKELTPIQAKLAKYKKKG